MKLPDAAVEGNIWLQGKSTEISVAQVSAAGDGNDSQPILPPFVATPSCIHVVRHRGIHAHEFAHTDHRLCLWLSEVCVYVCWPCETCVMMRKSTENLCDDAQIH
jgi:hypothetical protein